VIIGSVWLFADSVDFLEDASINFLRPLGEQEQAGQQQRSV
jgi:hypothetical protein